LVSAITVKGLEHINENEIKRVVETQELAPRFFLFSQQNILLLDVKKVKELINSKYVLDQLIISKKFPDGLEIILKEKISTIVWQKNDQKFLVDLKGVAFEQLDPKTPEEEINRFPKVEDITSQELALGGVVAPQEVIDEVVGLARDLPESLFIRPESFI
jgi:cell division septal protein FtsQ